MISPATMRIRWRAMARMSPSRRNLPISTGSRPIPTTGTRHTSPPERTAASTTCVDLPAPKPPTVRAASEPILFTEDGTVRRFDRHQYRRHGESDRFLDRRVGLYRAQLRCYICGAHRSQSPVVEHLPPVLG